MPDPGATLDDCAPGRPAQRRQPLAPGLFGGIGCRVGLGDPRVDPCPKSSGAALHNGATDFHGAFTIAPVHAPFATAQIGQEWSTVGAGCRDPGTLNGYLAALCMPKMPSGQVSDTLTPANNSARPSWRRMRIYPNGVSCRFSEQWVDRVRGELHAVDGRVG